MPVKRVKREDTAEEADGVGRQGLGAATGRTGMYPKGVEVREGEGSWRVWTTGVRE